MSRSGFEVKVAVMTEQTKTSEGRISTLVIPFAGAIVKGADKLGDVVEGAVLWGFKNNGTAGTGKAIRELAGAVADRAARAAIGGGPELMGGKGIAGGNSRLAMVGNVVAGVVIVGAAAAVFLGDAKLEDKDNAPTPRRTCEKCQAEHLVVSVDGSDDEAVAVCGQCGQCGQANVGPA